MGGGGVGEFAPAVCVCIDHASSTASVPIISAVGVWSTVCGAHEAMNKEMKMVTADIWEILIFIRI